MNVWVAGVCDGLEASPGCIPTSCPKTTGIGSSIPRLADRSIFSISLFKKNHHYKGCLGLTFRLFGGEKSDSTNFVLCHFIVRKVNQTNLYRTSCYNTVYLRHLQLFIATAPFNPPRLSHSAPLMIIFRYVAHERTGHTFPPTSKAFNPKHKVPNHNLP